MIEQRDARLDQDQRPEVGIAAADRRGSVHHRGHARRPPALRPPRGRGPHGRSPRYPRLEPWARGPWSVDRLGRPPPLVLVGSTSGASPGSWTWTCGPPFRSSLRPGRIRTLDGWGGSGGRGASCPRLRAVTKEGSPDVGGRATHGAIGSNRRSGSGAAPREADAVAKSSSAWVTAPSLPVSPASIRESSWMRSSSESTRTVAVTDSFSTRMWRSAKQAICGKVCDDQHLSSLGQVRESAADRETRLSSDPRVDFVEHERRHVVEVRHHAPAREHGA